MWIRRFIVTPWWSSTNPSTINLARQGSRGVAATPCRARPIAANLMDCPSCGLVPGGVSARPGIAHAPPEPRLPGPAVRNAHAVAEPRPTLAERRLVSVLFLGWLGSGPPDPLDPEDVRRSIALLRDGPFAVARAGGSLGSSSVM
jgi:hypothetical protein